MVKRSRHKKSTLRVFLLASVCLSSCQKGAENEPSSVGAEGHSDQTAWIEIIPSVEKPQTLSAQVQGNETPSDEVDLTIESDLMAMGFPTRVDGAASDDEMAGPMPESFDDSPDPVLHARGGESEGFALTGPMGVMSSRLPLPLSRRLNQSRPGGRASQPQTELPERFMAVSQLWGSGSRSIWQGVRTR